MDTPINEIPSRIYANLLRVLDFAPPPSTSGYTPIPTQSYGATGEGEQTLGSDGSKIEPKVWLASERTMLNWLRVSVLISTFALALFNGAKEGDWVAKTMGVAYTMLAIGMLGYAWAMQEQRRRRILFRFGGAHDELYGPIVVCSLLFVAVLANFILRVNQREALRNVPSPKNPWITSVELIQSAFVL